MIHGIQSYEWRGVDFSDFSRNLVRNSIGKHPSRSGSMMGKWNITYSPHVVMVTFRTKLAKYIHQHQLDAYASAIAWNKSKFILITFKLSIKMNKIWHSFLMKIFLFFSFLFRITNNTKQRSQRDAGRRRRKQTHRFSIEHVSSLLSHTLPIAS